MRHARTGTITKPMSSPPPMSMRSSTAHSSRLSQARRPRRPLCFRPWQGIRAAPVIERNDAFPSGSRAPQRRDAGHNALPHLDAAVRSILDQSHREFEFVIYDDASTDGSTERCAMGGRGQPHPLVRRPAQPRSRGQLDVRHGAGERALVARMDADDVSHPSAWSGSSMFGEKPKAGLVGTLFEVIDASGRGCEARLLAACAPFGVRSVRGPRLHHVPAKRVR